MTLNIKALAGIETPAIVIDEATALANIAAFQRHCDAAGLRNRPHIKTHKTVHFARAQIAAGAVGITCQKIGEAEVMARAGIRDIQITFNILGAAKLARLRALAGQVDRLSVVADSTATVAGLSAAFADADKPLEVLVECDTGAERCGVQIPAEAVALAQVIAASPGLRFQGLMNYPAPGQAARAAEFMVATRDLLAGAGLVADVISTGGSPDMKTAATMGVFTEYRIGTYIYNDRSLVERGVCGWGDCALALLVTVVSTPAPGRAVIDAGSKGLTSDLSGLQGHGHVLGSTDTQIARLSEEHGVLIYGAADSYAVGDRLLIVPNHVCPVSNLFDAGWRIGADGQITAQPIDARGLVV